MTKEDGGDGDDDEDQVDIVPTWVHSRRADSTWQHSGQQRPKERRRRTGLSGSHSPQNVVSGEDRRGRKAVAQMHLK
ncbi:hypothetical protein F441_13296 [Phytophthora nicotianae CJ01A1]|uniref:Uncharacterized protein n=1 Tax=Phytophthora nicotianae CJ01A1 TaxID=1317063 RepID=W2WNL9_PHYNI|nr:hypothetical protein F441_13296 [Phytophthora nicotianae CJ01A1]